MDVLHIGIQKFKNNVFFIVYNKKKIIPVFSIKNKKGNTNSSFVDNCNNGITRNALSLNKRCKCYSEEDYTIQDIEFSSAFGGGTAVVDASYNYIYTFPNDAEGWTGFAVPTTSNEIGGFLITGNPVKMCRKSKLSFCVEDISGTGNTIDICFKFEKNPYPDTEPSYRTKTTNIPTTGDYCIEIPSQGSNTYSNFILYLKRNIPDEPPSQNISITLSKVTLTNTYF